MTVLATDGGPHPADKWGSATAAMLVPLDGIEEGARRNAAMRLQANIADALTAIHDGVQGGERDGLTALGSAHLHTAFDHAPHSAAGVAAVIACAAGTPWEAHFADPDRQGVIGDVLENHFNTNAMVERLWHADRNPDCPIASAFQLQHHNETIVPSDEPEAAPVALAAPAAVVDPAPLPPIADAADVDGADRV